MLTRFLSQPARIILQVFLSPITLAREFLALKGHYLAAAIAFYGFLSVFPLTIALMTILHLTLGETRFDEVIVDNLIYQIPVLAQATGPSFLESFVAESSANPAVTSSVSGLVLFVSALGVFGAIRESINIMWGLRARRSIFKQKLIDAGFMILASMLLFASLAMTALYTVLNDLNQLLWNDSGWISHWLIDVVGVSAPWFINLSIFTLLYRVLPNTKVQIRQILPIAIIAAIASELVKLGFIYYLHVGSDRFLTVYGSVSALMMFFMFIYAQAIVLLIGALLCSKWIALVRKVATS